MFGHLYSTQNWQFRETPSEAKLRIQEESNMLSPENLTDRQQMENPLEEDKCDSTMLWGWLTPSFRPKGTKIWISLKLLLQAVILYSNGREETPLE